MLLIINNNGKIETQEMYDICSSLDFDDYLNDDCSEDQVLIKYFYKDENGEQKKIKNKR